MMVIIASGVAAGNILATTFLPVSYFVETSTSSSTSSQAAHGGEPQYYCTNAYYSNGYIYAKSASQFDKAVIFAI